MLPILDNHFRWVQQWWQELWARIPGCYRDWPCLLAVDANTLVGSEIDQHVGGHDAGPAEERAEHFQTFLPKTHTFLPATFEHLHSGTSGTWTHSGGHQRRIDYIGIPLQWPLRQCKSFVEDAFDPSILRSDHEAVCVQLDFPATGQRGKHQRHYQVGPLDLTAACELQKSLRGSVPLEADVHSHTAVLQNQIESALARAPRDRHKLPKKQTMSMQTWQLVQCKRGASWPTCGSQQSPKEDSVGATFRLLAVWRFTSS